MVFTELQTEIRTLSRQEKYWLVQFIVSELNQEESLSAHERPAPQILRQREQQETSKTQAIDLFLKKWKGFLKGVNPDDAKYRYLQEKYR
ncbi:hypothetical protein JXO59_05640 [candidate division KSB1 bacterium]|nr:hypothetical protein [candidate division KSB1 bacterium]